jgi:DNA-binding SARP family transcriptional activator
MRTAIRVHPDAEPAPADPKLRVGVLGGISLSIDGRTMVLPHRKARVIVGFLALARGTPVSRELLANLLWDTAEARSRGALRTTLYELRRVMKACGCNAVEDSDPLRLLPGLWDTDLTHVMDSIASGEVPATLAAQPNALGRLLAGYEDVSQGVRAWI